MFNISLPLTLKDTFALSVFLFYYLRVKRVLSKESLTHPHFTVSVLSDFLDAEKRFLNLSLSLSFETIFAPFVILFYYLRRQEESSDKKSSSL